MYSEVISMQKEFIIKTSRSVTLNVTGGKIDSFREKEETTGTVRVYENGCIGIVLEHRTSRN